MDRGVTRDNKRAGDYFCIELRFLIVRRMIHFAGGYRCRRWPLQFTDCYCNTAQTNGIGVLFPLYCFLTEIERSDEEVTLQIHQHKILAYAVPRT